MPPFIYWPELHMHRALHIQIKWDRPLKLAKIEAKVLWKLINYTAQHQIGEQFCPRYCSANSHASSAQLP